MYAMVVKMTVDSSRAGEVREHFTRDVIPFCMSRPGFVSGQWLLAESQGMGVVLYDSKANAISAANGPRSNPRIDGRAWNVDDVTVFEQVELR